MDMIIYLMLYDYSFLIAIFIESLNIPSQYKMRRVKILDMFGMGLKLLTKIGWCKYTVYDLGPEMIKTLLTCSDLRDSKKMSDNDGE